VEEILLSLLLAHPYWVLAGLFGIVFLESSVCPFLPGDTLLFTAGLALRTSQLSVHAGALLFLLATVLGVTVNYLIGWRLRIRIRDRGLWGITVAQLRRAEHLTERHGARLLVLGRFLPGVRVVVPLLAGAGQMPFMRFTVYNLLGGVPWIGMFVYSGYFFGALPGVHAYLVPVGVFFLLIGLLPILIRWSRQAWRRAHPN
jgi:membrane-associated protein